MPEKAESMHRTMMAYLNGVDATRPTQKDLEDDRRGELMKKPKPAKAKKTEKKKSN